ncbi:hypothetical protein Eyrgjafa_gp_18 [Pelagibacter phage Eyrgjafa EXVC018P]|uniref:Uncharacterized protein n=1 Tax=Pelagibacter phage Eyrgjafa EXVC018P TaxID=2736227 RepID=A0A7S6C5B9_9CAUD|nr:hypothetical protein Eyrgjafa_gp_18 [Pelagibacter phage Eyrgjafa EXVC018P]QLF88223.1 hypothetical protein Gjalp_gp31 [Pelagibacter phage Gjalp EXVC020P]
MTKARNIADLLDATGDVKSTALDNVPASDDASALTTGTLDNARLPSNISDNGTEGTKVAVGTTAQRGSTTGQWRFNSTTGFFEGVGANGVIASLEPDPVISSIDDTEVDTETGGNQTFVVIGSSFTTGGTISFIGSDGTNFNATSTTHNSATQQTAVVPKSSFVNSKEPYDIKFTSASGKSGVLENVINVDNAPSWSTSAGNVGNVLEGTAISPTIQLSATDPEGDTVTYSETTSALSGAGFSLSSSGTITGTAQTVSGDTTTNFTARATAGSKTTDRNFNIITKNLNSDALLFDATNLPSNSDVYTSNTNGASVGLALENGTSLSPSTAVTLSTINGVTNGTLANGAVVSNQTNLYSNYNKPSPYGEINYGNTFWSMVKGGTHDTPTNNAWFGIYHAGSPSNGHIWWTWDLGANPSVKLKRMVGAWTWRTGSADFNLYGSNSAPNSGSAMQSSFSTTGLTNLLSKGSLPATFDWTLTNTAYYRYYVFRLQNGGGTYDYGMDRVKIYGDYY